MTRGSEVRTHELTQECLEIIKNKLVEYFLEKHNISWLDDNFEREIYNVIFELLDKYIILNFWGEE